MLNRQHINDLPEIFRLKGISHIIISSGSRNAPLIQSFVRKKQIKCISITDERSAGYFALGLAKEIKKPVGLLCTSGTAVLNYAPAIAEAYYQNVPLIILTADRPPEWIDQQDNQTIRQKNVYANFIKCSYQLPVENNSKQDILASQKLIFEAIYNAITPPSGPVHINIPLREPIYKVEWQNAEILEHFDFPAIANQLSGSKWDAYIDKWNNADKKMIIFGMQDFNSKLNKLANLFSLDKSVMIIAENISNISGENVVECPEKVISAIRKDDLKEFAPEILITIGSQVVSKQLKEFLRKNKPAEHWRINPDNLLIDTYKALTEVVPVKPEIFLNKLMSRAKGDEGSCFREKWLELKETLDKKQSIFLQKTKYSELKIFEIILNAIPGNSSLHLGNSMPIRYSQYFHTRKDLKYYSNRGTSGIDGCLSTASGAAYAHKSLTTIIMGDMSFIYDSNALWNSSLPANLRIIVINNHGGRIFELVEGASETEGFEEFMKTFHKVNIRELSKAFNIDYLYCNNLNNLVETLPVFFSLKKKTTMIMEIDICDDDNRVFNDYLKFIRYGKKKLEDN